MNLKVARWYDEIEHEIKKRWDSDPPIVLKTFVAIVLALIETESNGNEYARDKGRPRGQFWGVLQQGAELSILLGHSRRFPKWKTSSYLHGNAELSIREFLAVLDLSKGNHLWSVELIAIQWKGGGGTCRTWKRMLADGLDPRDQPPFNNRKKWQYRVPIYLDRFKRSFANWLEYDPPAPVVGAIAGAS